MMAIKNYKKVLWKWFSLYIRLRDANWKGEVACCSCGKVKHYKQMDAGHFIPKTAGNSIYFEEKNVHPQCDSCNRQNHGNLSSYALYLIKRYGPEIITELNWKRYQKCDITHLDYLRLIEEYKKKVKALDFKNKKSYN